MTETNFSIRSKYGSIDLYSGGLILKKKSLSKHIEIPFEKLKETHLHKASCMYGYIRFILNDDDTSKCYNSFSDENTLLFDKLDENNFINLLNEITKYSNSKTEIYEAENNFNIFLQIFNVFFVIFLVLTGFIAIFNSDFLLGLFFIILGITLIKPIKYFINSKIYKFLNNFNNNEKQIKIITGIAKFIIFFVLFCIIIDNMPATETNQTEIQKQQIEQSTKNKYRNNKNVKLIAQETGLDENSAEKVYKTLVNCGIGNINSIKLFAKNVDYADSYNIEAYGIPTKLVVYIDEKGNIPDLYYEMKNIITEGKKVANITDYVLTQNEWVDLRVHAETFLENFLVAPKTSKFKNKKYNIDENKIITVTGTVESENLYGVPLENNFNLQYKRENNDFKIIKGTLGGEKIYP